MALQKHPPQCRILPWSRSGAQAVPRSLAECRALLRVTLPAAASSPPRGCNRRNPRKLSSRYFYTRLRKSGLFWPTVRSLTNARHVPPDPLLLILDRDGFGLRLLRSRTLLMYLAALQLAVSIGPEGDVRCHIAGRKHMGRALCLQAPPHRCTSSARCPCRPHARRAAQLPWIQRCPARHLKKFKKPLFQSSNSHGVFSDSERAR